MVESCINIHHLKKRYPGEEKFTLQDIDLNINVGEKYGILGPNGAGKTTLISILCGLMEQSNGEVAYWGKTVSGMDEIQKKIGFVPQEYAFYNELSPVQNIQYFGAMYGLDASTIRNRTTDILQVLGLAEVKNKKVGKFSGGMKRRVNLAIGIIHQPSVLFLDEPTVGVDIQSKMAILRFLNELNEKGTTIIYTSHHLDEAQEFCTHIALIDNGKIITHGETDALLKQHNSNDLKDLLITFTGESYRD